MTDWSNLNMWQLRDLARWCDWAEHHAMREFAHATGDESYLVHESENSRKIPNQNRWRMELKELAEIQPELRRLIEKWKPPTP